MEFTVRSRKHVRDIRIWGAAHELDPFQKRFVLRIARSMPVKGPELSRHIATDRRDVIHVE